MGTQIPKSEIGEPTWEIAALFPEQGLWTEDEYLRLDTNKLVEFNNGRLEVLPMPTELHQLIVSFLFRRLCATADDLKLGLSLMAPLRIQIHNGRYREPDIVFMLHEHRDRRRNDYWLGADLVMEVVSDDDPKRDLVTKRQEYAESAIPEYWIVDPRDRSITILSLDEPSRSYHEVGRFQESGIATSKLLPKFSVTLSEVFDQDQSASE